jgi:hypothetical protein
MRPEAWRKSLILKFADGVGRQDGRTLCGGVALRIRGLNCGSLFLRSDGLKQDHEKAMGGNWNHGKHAADRADYKKRFEYPDEKRNDDIQSAATIPWKAGMGNYLVG